MFSGQSSGYPITDSCWVSLFLNLQPPSPSPPHQKQTNKQTNKKELPDWQLRGLSSYLNFLKFYQPNFACFLTSLDNLPTFLHDTSLCFLHLGWSQLRKSQGQGMGRAWGRVRSELYKSTCSLSSHRHPRSPSITFPYS